MTIFLSSLKKTIKIDFYKHLANLALINQAIYQAVNKHFQKTGLIYVDVPEIVGITGACENVDTLFKVNNRLNLPLFITQTGQLALEQYLQSFSGVWTIIHSGRDEKEEDSRHLRQFRLIEEEFDCRLAGMDRFSYDAEKMFNTLLTHIENSIKAMIKAVLENYCFLLEKTYFRLPEKLKKAIESSFLRISYEEAIKLLQKNGFPTLQFGDDLSVEHEAKIVSLVNKKNEEIPVFITHYPKEIKFFNMKVYSKNPKLVLSADLIFPYAGEAVGSAVREDDFDHLNERLLTSKMFEIYQKRGGKYEDFWWYLEMIKNQKTYPHAGYGIGNERVLQYIFGLKDIRQVSLFSLLSQKTGDWDISKRQQIYSLLGHKKSILLSIGRITNKKKLLPYIKKISQADYLLCATKKTHQFLKKNGIMTTLVYKISEIGKNPNLYDLLKEGLFDLIINIPTKRNGKTKEFTDGQKIRQMAIERGITLITDPELAIFVLSKLAK